MGAAVQSIFTIVLSVEFITGSLGNGFIALVNCVDWIRRKKISPVDRILTALAISRIGLLWLVYLEWWESVLYTAFWMTADSIRMVNLAWAVVSHFSIWLATSLSIFYFLKIANFSNSAFLYLNWRARQVVSGTLLLSLVFLLVNIVLINTHVDVWMDGFKGNLPESSSLRNPSQILRRLAFINTVFAFIPFAVSLTTFLLLIFSLWRHLKTMQRRTPGCRDASSTAHMKALKTVVAFLLLYAIFFLSLLVNGFSSDFLYTNLILSFVRAAALVFPSVHSYVLILCDTKLRRASISVLWWLRGRSTDVGPSGPLTICDHFADSREKSVHTRFSY